jgi:hypothetical protein
MALALAAWGAGAARAADGGAASWHPARAAVHGGPTIVERNHLRWTTRAELLELDGAYAVAVHVEVLNLGRAAVELGCGPLVFTPGRIGVSCSGNFRSNVCVRPGASGSPVALLASESQARRAAGRFRRLMALRYPASALTHGWDVFAADGATVVDGAARSGRGQRKRAEGDFSGRG